MSWSDDEKKALAEAAKKIAEDAAINYPNSGIGYPGSVLTIPVVDSSENK